MELHAQLVGSCDRLEVAGSIRRQRPEVNDIEFVAVPKRDPFDRLQLRLTTLVSESYLNVGSKSRDGKRAPLGPRYYRLSFRGTQVDIFCVLPPSDWGVQFCLRTGSREYSHWIVTEALRRDFKVDSGQLWKIHKERLPWEFEKIRCPEERDFFKALGIEYVDPRDREIE
jgi:DNA polymerase/3'-5' exonuclease PolX